MQVNALFEKQRHSSGQKFLLSDRRSLLQQLWKERAATQESLLHALQEWCRQAESTGIKALEDFAFSLRGYVLQPA